LTITTCDERVHPARVVARDALADLAVLEVELKAGTADRIQAVPLAGTEGYTPGSVVVKMGFPAGHRLHRAVGDVLPVINNPVGRADVVFTVAAAHARSGDSGGGLFRVSDGALVGVVWGGLPPKDPSFGLRASRLPEIHQLVKRAGVPLPPP
jgi:S1-C subfamily serine protease